MLPYDSIKREVVTKRKYYTNVEPIQRSLLELLNYGIINLDKPPGPTSHEVVSHVKSILSIKKAGHSGTLDPKVTGVLPVALNKATKVLRYLLTAGKEYVCLMHLHKDVPKEGILQTFEFFKGKIKQLPPVKSAVKRRVRERHIYEIKVLEIEGRDVLFRVSCEAGTYIRKLVHDFGVKLGVGANMQELRRTRVGPFTEDDNLVTLQDLVDAKQEFDEGNEEPLMKIIFPIEKAVEHLPKVWASDKAVETIRRGAKLAIPGIVKLHTGIKKGDTVAIMGINEELIAIGQAEMSTEEILSRERGIAFSLKRVI